MKDKSMNVPVITNLQKKRLTHIRALLILNYVLTRLSLSFGGSWGSVAERLGGGGGDGALGFSLTVVSALGFSVFSAGAA